MPFLLSTCFREFLDNITISGDLKKTADARRRAIVDLLGGHFEILDSFPTGSVVRGTALRNASDLDVMAVLHYGKHLKDKSPVRVLEDVRDALADYNAKIVKKNGQAVTLYFTTWPNVDIVPCKRVGTSDDYVLQIPDANTGEWISTDPAAHDRAMARLPARRRQLVRMVKCWNRAHSEYFRSFHIEQVAIQMSGTTDEEEWTESSWPWSILKFFERAIELTEPTASLAGPYSVEDWKELRSRLRRAKDLALDAWHAVYKKNEVEHAVDRLRILFGDQFPAYG
jgi:hypothetical protein